MRLMIENYQPKESVREMVAQFPPVLLAGISGAGKNAIISQLLKTGKYHDLITCTTRSPRENDGVMEQEGVDYYFLSNNQAQTMLEQQAFIEAKLVHGTIYGSSVAEYEKAVRTGKIPIADIDVQGVLEYKAMAPNTTALFILPPSYEVWLERLRGRFKSETEFMAVWPKRCESAIQELQTALECQQFEWVINDNLTEAVETVKYLAASSSTDFVTKEQKQIAEDLLARLKAE